MLRAFMSILAKGLEGAGRLFGTGSPRFPVPTFFKFIWWFLANHFRRWRDARYPHLRPNVIYSPGINCIDKQMR